MFSVLTATLPPPVTMTSSARAVLLSELRFREQDEGASGKCLTNGAAADGFGSVRSGE